MSGKHAKKTFSARRRIVMGATIAVGGVAIPATFAGTAAAVSVTSDDTPVSPSPSPTAATPTDAPTPAPTCTPAADVIVKHGDTLSGITAQLKLKLTDVEKSNPNIIKGDRPDDYSLIYAGGHVHMPSGTCSTTGSGAHARPNHHRWYASCDDAPNGLHRGQAGYRHALDMDGDGKACEGPWPPATTDPTTPPVIVNPGGEGDAGGTGSTDSSGNFVPVIAPDGVATPSGYVAHSPSYWIPLIDQAMSIVGGGVAQGNQVDAVVQRITIESSGDPNAINNYDSNAQNGDPSRGLMQTIGATFNGNHVAGTSTNIYDPLANICAALAYINAQYGGTVPLGSTY